MALTSPKISATPIRVPMLVAVVVAPLSMPGTIHVATASAIGDHHDAREEGHQSTTAAVTSARSCVRSGYTGPGNNWVKNIAVISSAGST